MKKVLSLSLILALGIAGFAQTRDLMTSQKEQFSPKVAIGNEKSTEVNSFQNVAKPGKAVVARTNRAETVDEYEVMINSFDLQSNAGISNRIAAFSDGSLSTVATFMPGDKSPWTQASQFRGTGYNHFDGSDWAEQPESRIESSMTGWPSIAQYGANGEILVVHTSNGLLYYTRENKGEGTWVGPKEIPSPEGHPAVTTDAYTPTWPRVATSGANHDIIHIVCCDQSNNGDIYENTIFYARSTDGENWTVEKFPTIDNDAVDQYTADDYCIVANGNNVAAFFIGGFSFSSDCVLVKSTDNGETWTKTVVWDNPFDGEEWNDPFMFDTVNHDAFYAPAMGALAMDNSGNAHIALTGQCIKCGDGDGTYSYYMGLIADGVFYWTEGDEPFTTGPTFENGYSDSYKALCPWDTYDLGVDEDGDGEEDYLVAYNDRWISGMVIAKYGEDLDQNVDGYWDYVQLQKFLLEHEDEEELPVDFDWVDYFPGYGEYRDHLYQGAGTYTTYNGNYAAKIGAGNLIGWPSITVDDNGIVAIAYSTPDFRRNYDGSNSYCYRAVYVTYIDHGVVYPNRDYLAEDFSHTVDEMTNVHALPTSYGNRQFVFGYMCDPNIGWAGASSTSESDPPAHNPTENSFFVTIVSPDEDITGINEVAVNPMTEMSVRPNPTTDNLYIDINAKHRSNVNATIYNVTGQKVMETELSALTTGNNTRSINVSNLTSGIYFVTVKANDFEVTKKFVVK